MILQALTEYYETLLELPPDKSKPPRFGWSQTNVWFAVSIDSTGTLKDIILLENDTNKKGRPTVVPMQLKRSGTKPPPYFLCDTATYVLGIDKGKITARSKAYFAAFSSYNKDILSRIDCLEARAVTNFLDNWDIGSALSNPIVQDVLPYDLGKGNLAFYIADTDTWVLDSPKIQTGWDKYYQESSSQGILGVCSVTGKDAPIARIHNSVKGIRTSTLSPNGWTLVGFDKGSPAFSSYGKEQGYNAPTSEYAAFAYTAALNHLLANRDHVFRVGDATVVCWAKGGGDLYQSLFSYAAMGQTEPAYDENDLRNMVKQLCQGNSVTYQEEKLDPNMDFFVLGLSPNAARLSVRFFLHNTFGGFLRNVQAHQKRLEIIQSVDNKFDTTPLWRLLYATVRSRAKYEPSSYKEARQNLEKYLPPELSGEVLRSILMNTRYPATLHNGVTLRIRAEHEITRSRAAVMKAYLLQNYCHLPIYSTLKEVLTVELNDSCNYQPYVLGCLFAVMEKIQLASADWKLNRTIKDSYFTSAATTPKNIYAKLFPLSEYHMKKLLRDKPGLANILGKEKSSLIGKLTTPIPSRFTPEETDCFYIGYYHQSNQKKEENKNV